MEQRKKRKAEQTEEILGSGKKNVLVNAVHENIEFDCRYYIIPLSYFEKREELFSYLSKPLDLTPELKDAKEFCKSLVEYEEIKEYLDQELDETIRDEILGIAMENKEDFNYKMLDACCIAERSGILEVLEEYWSEKFLVLNPYERYKKIKIQDFNLVEIVFVVWN